MNYREYLRSPRWQRIRARILKRDGYKCRSCGRRAWQVHHASYDVQTMAGGADHNLYSLCGRCHEAVTFDLLGLKRLPAEVLEMTKALPPLGAKRSKKSRKRDAALERAIAIIEAARIPNGGWTREQLAEWGVSWPPHKGWLKYVRGKLAGPRG